ncbi:VIT1/CCC1 transporter family protein [Nocardia sp. NPDC050799]|uniref:VIT1/CCC1 transporter family protein n=1 Tax=Nocardia sp. NPDC050799 TaxID=3154842 RepID=UPI0033F929D7
MTEAAEDQYLPQTGLAAKLNWLRAGVLGANDGIVSTAGLVVGVAAASSNTDAILTAGIAGISAGAISMALALTGSISAGLGGSSRPRAMARVVIGGALAMAVTYGIGKLADVTGI